MIAPRRTVRSSSAWYAARISALAAAGNAASGLGVVNQAPRLATAPLTSTEGRVGVNTAVEVLYLHGGISRLLGCGGGGRRVARVPPRALLRRCRAVGILLDSRGLTGRGRRGGWRRRCRRRPRVQRDDQRSGAQQEQSRSFHGRVDLLRRPHTRHGASGYGAGSSRSQTWMPVNPRIATRQARWSRRIARASAACAGTASTALPRRTAAGNTRTAASTIGPAASAKAVACSPRRRRALQTRQLAATSVTSITRPMRRFIGNASVVTRW